MSVLDHTAPARADRRASVLPDVVAAGLCVVVLVLLGAPAGLLWARVVPDVLVVPQGGDAFSYVDAETRAFLGGDVAFGVLGLVLGALCGAGAYLLVRRSGPGAVVGLTVGGVLAGEIARRVGQQVGLDAFRDAIHAGPTGGTLVEPALLRASELVLAWPVGALAVFTVLVWLRPGSRRWGLSSG